MWQSNAHVELHAPVNVVGSTIVENCCKQLNWLLRGVQQMGDLDVLGSPVVYAGVTGGM